MENIACDIEPVTVTLERKQLKTIKVPPTLKKTIKVPPTLKKKNLYNF